MCGIVGFITNPDDAGTTTYSTKYDWWATPEYKRGEWLQTALILDTLRGDDSTGVMGKLTNAKAERRYGWLKDTGPGWNFIQNESFGKDYVDRVEDYAAIVGHNRAATMGKVTAKNAHPFCHGDVTLVHNGTLRSMASLPYRDKGIEVDSEMIAFNLSQVEPDEADKVLSKLDGAFALVWFDRRDHSVNIIRNRERPLHLTLAQDESALYFMSEGIMLEQSLRRHRINHGPVYQLDVQTWLKFKDGSFVPEVRDVPPFVYSPPKGTGNYHAHTQSSTTGYNYHGGQGGAYAYTPAARKFVRADGKVTDYPEQWIEELNWFNLDKDKDYPFRPAAFNQYPQPNATSSLGYVDGEMYIPQLETWVPARIHRVWKDSWTSGAETRMWAVAPLFPHYRSGDLEMCVKHISTYPTKTSTENMPIEEVESPFAPEVDEDECFFPGPRGGVTSEQWDKLVESGCCMCGGNIRDEDADEVLWVGERNDQPLCPKCAQEMTETL